MSKIWTFVCQFMKHSMSDKFNWKFYVSKRRTKPYAATKKEII